MSLTIACPHCGARPVTEYLYGEMPEVPVEITEPDAVDLYRNFMRKNTEGVQTERWFHVYGCRRWITVQRNTRNDDVIAVS